MAEVESILEKTGTPVNQITGSSSAVTQGAVNTDALLIFTEAVSQGTTQDSVIIRYQEGSVSEQDFANELSVLAVFEDVADFEVGTVV